MAQGQRHLQQIPVLSRRNNPLPPNLRRKKLHHPSRNLSIKLSSRKKRPKCKWRNLRITRGREATVAQGHPLLVLGQVAVHQGAAHRSLRALLVLVAQAPQVAMKRMSVGRRHLKSRICSLWRPSYSQTKTNLLHWWVLMRKWNTWKSKQWSKCRLRKRESKQKRRKDSWKKRRNRKKRESDWRR